MSVTLNPQILGQAENAHRALLNHLLAANGAGIGYRDWVAIKIILGAVGAHRAEIAARIAGSLKVDTETAQAALSGLVSSGLLDDGHGLALTEDGRALHDRVSAAIDTTLGRVYGEIPADDLATTGRVLAALTARVNAELAA